MKSKEKCLWEKKTLKTRTKSLFFLELKEKSDWEGRSLASNVVSAAALFVLQEKDEGSYFVYREKKNDTSINPHQFSPQLLMLSISFQV